MERATKLARLAVRGGIALALVAFVLGFVLEFVASPGGSPVYPISFEEPGGSCLNSVTLYVDVTSGQELQCAANGDSNRAYRGALTSSERAEVLRECSALAQDGRLDGDDQVRVRQLIAAIASRHPAVPAGPLRPVLGPVLDYSPLAVAAGLVLLVLGVIARIVLLAAELVRGRRAR
ncbi:hypothetical protein Dvina_29725 [Dactylosporangium vinaceum]|uniref:Uncharacterized protein n=1 Tax=Dactylosporangium vinaceum TaxID=53362 RepID=A0ABV5ME36_9ACTN|nr:hypothetical protein [Dactylosporangium vinaceum]UAB92523.1 hypothetical protein Dvina_29725 [Dactylosporangium vinaceum]